MVQTTIDPTKLYIPDALGGEGRIVNRPWFLPSKETLNEQEKLLSSVYFLVKQGDTFGERLRCTRCGARHNYITLMCVEKPITGLAGGLYAYYRAVSDHHLEGELSEAEQARLTMIKRALMDMPDLGTVHPDMARQVMKDVGPSDLQLGAASLGVLEGIAPIHAFKLVQKINDRGLRPKLVLNAPTTADVQRAKQYMRI